MDLPLLVPSFSSKGFGFYVEKSEGTERVHSETNGALDVLGAYLHESFLISAYDLFHDHYASPKKHLETPRLLFLDSGGYELAPEFDSTEPKITPVRNLPFSFENYLAVLDDLVETNSDASILVANYDWDTKHTPFERQIQSSKRLFDSYPHWGKNLLLKPASDRSDVIEVDALLPVVAELRDFDVVGVTEKELGHDLLDRLRRLARLRVLLTRNDIHVPIHVWGGLDPTITPLYYFAGGEIFDGVSWMRYYLHEGLAVNLESSIQIRGDLAAPYDESIVTALSSNISYLAGLATSLQVFGSSENQDFTVFEHGRENLKRAFETMRSQISELEEIW
ncbi:MAG: hypothetical protein GKR94_17310 [Gammaproteobacteria bacterium]|nr:hypothetical protein [Gammaproteobacteria bacterium]